MPRRHPGAGLPSQCFERALEHAPEQAAARLLQEGHTGRWGEYQESHLRLADRLLANLWAQHSELAAWLNGMLQADPVFEAQCDRFTGRDGMVMVRAIADLARHPDRWRDHRPGEPWPYELS